MTDSTCTSNRTTISGRFLVQRQQQQNPTTTTTTTTTTHSTDPEERQRHDPSPRDDDDDSCSSLTPESPHHHRLLISNVGLSFWGGIDPVTGIIVDASHPLAGECVANTILCLPSGRGSCTASQVLLELLLNDQRVAPAAIVLRDADGLACVGAIVAQEIFQHAGLDIVCTGSPAYEQLWNMMQQQPQQQSTIPEGAESSVLRGRILSNGHLELVRPETAAGESIPPTVEHRDIQQQAHTANTTTTAAAAPSNHPPPNNALVFSKQEKQFLDQATSQAERMALRVIFRYARLVALVGHDEHNNNSDVIRYLPITQAHIDGCTYIGPGGLEFCRRLVASGGKVKVPTTLNSGSTDRRRWLELGVPQPYAQNAIALGNAYQQLGCQPSFTCAPYLLSLTMPQLGQDVAWGESNAVVYANSVLGARTEKYADYMDICCALTGIVPATGVHLTPHRRPTLLLDATELLQSLLTATTSLPHQDSVLHKKDDDSRNRLLDLDLLFPLLGHLCGNLSDGRVPLLLGMQNDSYWQKITRQQDYHLKAFCAAFGTTAASPLIHIAGVTPEAQDPVVVNEFIAAITSKHDNNNNENVRTLTLDQLQATFDLLDNAVTGGKPTEEDDNSIDLVALGNPHLSVSECRDLATLISDTTTTHTATHQQQQRHPDTRIMACMSRTVYAEADAAGHIAPLHQFGVEFVFDTCWCMLLDAPVIPVQPGATILTNSGKYAHYGPGLTQRQFRLGSMADCIRATTTGLYPRRQIRSGGTLAWLSRAGKPEATRPPVQQRNYSSRPSRSTATLLRSASMVRRAVSAVLRR